jgi:hypothetical protein
VIFVLSGVLLQSELAHAVDATVNSSSSSLSSVQPGRHALLSLLAVLLSVPGARAAEWDTGDTVMLITGVCHSPQTSLLDQISPSHFHSHSLSPHSFTTKVCCSAFSPSVLASAGTRAAEALRRRSHLGRRSFSTHTTQ